MSIALKVRRRVGHLIVLLNDRNMQQTDTFSRLYATFFNQQHLLTFSFLPKYVSLDRLTNAEGKHNIYFV